MSRLDNKPETEGVWDKAWRTGKCDNGCGDIVKIPQGVSIAFLVPEEAIDMNWEEDSLGYLIAICPKCGFVLTTDKPPGTEG